MIKKKIINKNIMKCYFLNIQSNLDLDIVLNLDHIVYLKMTKKYNNYKFYLDLENLL